MTNCLFHEFDVPIALIFFNRPRFLTRVFGIIQTIKPKQLFLIQDGPRANHPEDHQNIQLCRNIVETIDWACETFYNYADHNLGCGIRPYTGISWVFSHVDSAIILEDDCVPNPSFFPFCKWLLRYYEKNERIGMISGLNHFEKWNCGASYFYAKAGANTGWATWKRVWDKYHFDFSDLEKIDKKLVQAQFPFKRAAESRMAAWKKGRTQILSGKNRSFWDLQLELCKFVNQYLTIIPAVNLISNIGIGKSATHNAIASPFNNLHTYEIVQFTHPDKLVIDKTYDERYYRLTCPSFCKKIVIHLSRNIPNNKA